MNGWEITCVIVGIILLFGYLWTPNNEKGVKFALIQNALVMIASLSLILLPFYFNYWRK